LVAVLNEASAARVGIVHGLAGAFVQDSRPAALSTGHGTVVFVLSKTISETISDENRLEVDVAFLVREYLVGEDWDVVASVGLARDMEALLRVLRELLEEESEQSIDVLAGGDGVLHRAATVRVSDIDRLVEEDDGGIGVP
jgi:hypothetical protein